MYKNCTLSHDPTSKPTFNQYVVGKYKTSLERQIAEAVRIDMRKSTLNSTGVYNRCKLTRLVVDSDWDKKVWDANWQEQRRERELCERLAEQGMLEEL